MYVKLLLNDENRHHHHDSNHNVVHFKILDLIMRTGVSLLGIANGQLEASVTDSLLNANC